MGFMFAAVILAVVMAIRPLGLRRLVFLAILVAGFSSYALTAFDRSSASSIPNAPNDENAFEFQVGEGDDADIPFYDVDQYCRYPQNNFATAQCIRSEQESYETLKAEWSELTPATRHEALEVFRKYRTTRYSGAEGVARLLLEKQRYFEGMRQTPPAFQR